MTTTLKKNTQNSNYQTRISGTHVAEEIKNRLEDKVFEVYWVRLAEHKDITSEGYVGITCQGTSTRFMKHRSHANNGNEDWLFHNAIRKHGHKNLLVDTMLVCDYKYALEIENKLRPRTFIGWNTCEGGGGGFLEGLEKLHGTPEFSKMRSEHMYGAWQDEEYVEKLMKSRKNYYDNTPPWRREGNAVNHLSWKMAGVCYLLHSKFGWNNGKISNYLMLNKGSMCRVFDYFKDGWNPLEDMDYQDMYPTLPLESVVEIYGDPEQYHISWRRSGSSPVWKVADELYDMFHRGTPLAQMAKHADATWHQTHKIHRKFENGWNPYKDLRWLVDFRGYIHEH